MYTLSCTINVSILLTLNHKGYDMHKNVYVLFFLTLLQSGMSFGNVTPPIGRKGEFPPIDFKSNTSIGLMPPVMEECGNDTPPVG